MRFFSSTDAVYEQARSVLDAAWSLPNDKGTTTCIDPADVAPRDADGRVLLAVDDVFCEYPAAAQLLELMLGTGNAAEITEAEYRAALPQEPA